MSKYIGSFLINIQVIAGINQTTIITKDGNADPKVKVFACGLNDKGQLGLCNDTVCIHTLTALPTLPDGKVAKQLVAAKKYTMIMAEDATVFGCGHNFSRQFGLSDNANRNTFTVVPTLLNRNVIKQIAASDFHTMILAENGTVFGCGCNSSGELGLGDDTDRSTFTTVPPLLGGMAAKQVTTGESHTMILTEDGTVFTCGCNLYGQLGLGDDTYRSTFTFTTVPPLLGGMVAKQVISGTHHTMILTQDGKVFACGYNAHGQLGLGDTTNRCTFTTMPAPLKIVVARQVNAGNCHTTILTEDGTVFTCGDNYHGQLGMGDDTDRKTFTAVTTLPEGVVARKVIAGAFHTIILTQYDRVFACGGNKYGQLGLGDATNRDTFTEVPL